MSSAAKLIGCGLGVALSASFLLTQSPASSAPRTVHADGTTTGARSACTVTRTAPKRQLRGEWIATVDEHRLAFPAGAHPGRSSAPSSSAGWTRRRAAG